MVDIGPSSKRPAQELIGPGWIVWLRPGKQVELRLERGLFHNYIGVQYMWGGLDYPDQAELFYRRAIDEFTEAETLLRDWYQPHENKADTYRFRAQISTGRSVGANSSWRGPRIRRVWLSQHI